MTARRVNRLARRSRSGKYVFVRVRSFLRHRWLAGSHERVYAADIERSRTERRRGVPNGNLGGAGRRERDEKVIMKKTKVYMTGG